MLPVRGQQVVSGHEADALLSPQAQTSVTEGTTGLLIEKLKEREKEPIYRKRRDTSPMD